MGPRHREVCALGCFGTVFYGFAWKTLVPLAHRRLATVSGLGNVPTKTPFILASNHISWLDPLYLLAALERDRGYRLHFISKTRRHAWAHTIPIDPTDRAACLRIAEVYIRQGESVGIFPEGYSNPEPTLPRGRSGVARLALASGSPIIPVGITGEPQPVWVGSLRNLIFPRNAARAAIQRRMYTVRIGTPIAVSANPDLPPNTVKDLTHRTMRAIAELCAKQYPYPE